MKKVSLLILLGFWGLCLTLQSCNKDECTAEHTYIEHTPVFVDIDDIHPEISVESPRPLKKPGKIYFYNDFILINEIHQGIHVIDNSVPSAPNPVSFIKVPGNVDMAVKSNTLYADCYFDLLAIDISDVQNPTLVGRQNDVRDYNDNAEQVLVYYNSDMVTRIEDCGTAGRNTGWFGGVFFQNADQNGVVILPNTIGGSGVGGSGVGGSFARFTISGNHLYTVDERDLTVYDISTVSTPTEVSTINVGWGIETIYPYGNNLFIGSNSGMFIFDNTNPATPFQTAQFAHMTACDPVAVQGDYAYVTLRSGNECQGFTNQLDLIDVKDIYNPKLVESFPMDNPHGVAITTDQTLFICEGDFGLKVFDASDPEKLDNNRIDYKKGLSTYDVIALPNGNLLVIGSDGFYQYDYTNPKNLKEISKISVER